LYSSYELLKRSGYFDWKCFSVNFANVLNFHRVNDYSIDDLTTPTGVFEEAMREISMQYKAVRLSVLIQAMKSKRNIEPRTVVVTFDDGYKDNFLNAAPILLKYGVPATFFITTGYINTQRVFEWDRTGVVNYPLMSWQDVRELANMGFEIGSHTFSHVNLGKVSMELAKQEIFNSKAQTENEIGMPVRSFAYPYGRKDCIGPDVVEIVKEAGYDCCCSGYGGKVSLDTDIYNLCRVPMYPSLIEFKMELDGFMTYYDGKMSINMFPQRYGR
jgi:peptidoglycan/xylan/chitin deacetylase (PgdA/CDA1 family)